VVGIWGDCMCCFERADIHHVVTSNDPYTPCGHLMPTSTNLYLNHSTVFGPPSRLNVNLAIAST
jgi:hypothetical protein